MKLTALFQEFFESEKTSGIILLVCTGLSLVLANSSIQHSYLSFWHYDLGGHSVEFWINDGLMTVFFLLVGLELEREVYIGELSTRKTAMLPAIAAVGGMAVPALIHFMLNNGTPTQAGAGIPMATDIAFAVGVLSLLGKRVPAALKVFLLALAVIDDLGAIFTIAFFYSGDLSWLNLGAALLLMGIMIVMNRMRIHTLWPYLALGTVMWYFMLKSGVHPTITGVLLAFAIPFQNGRRGTVSYRLQHHLHKPVSFIILPLFALANTAIVIRGGVADIFSGENGLGIFLGLVVGKPVGITLFAFIAIVTGISSLPRNIYVRHIAGAGCLGGIGFTMSIFVTLLAFEDGAVIDASKVAVLVSSLIAGITGLVWLMLTLRKTSVEN